MFKDFILFIKYPYTAGVIITIWLGSAALLAINNNLDPIRVVIIDLIVTVVVASLGFNGKSER